MCGPCEIDDVAAKEFFSKSLESEDLTGIAWRVAACAGGSNFLVFSMFS